MSYFIFLMCIVFSLPANAGIEGELKNIVKEMKGDFVNKTKASTFHDQSAGHYTGGSLFVRNRVHKPQILHVTMPRLNAGCGGIDLYMGGISFIRSEELKKTMQAVIKSGSSLAFGLALSTWSPQLKAALDELAAKLQDINNLALNSCQAAATLMGGVLPRTQATSEALCHQIGISNSKFTDWAAARQECNTKPEQLAGLSAIGFDDVLQAEFNLAWWALHKAGLTHDREMAELFMSITGTIISKKAGGTLATPVRQHYHSLALDGNLMKAMIYGEEEVEYYACEGTGTLSRNGCLELHKKKKKIDGNNALIESVANLLSGIAEKVRKDDSALDDAERALIQSTRLPILKFMAVQIAWRGTSQPVDVQKYAEIIAIDQLLFYFDTVLSVVSQNIHQLEAAQLDGQIIADFRKEVRHMRARIAEQENSLNQKLMANMAAIEHMQQIEKKLLSTMASSAMEAGGYR